ncbi:MAG: peptidoglycan DD-metalloendopeptidase family protein, partial [Pyrinomonadaceae bacterium]|nr:peptidoglycan DD-metalloendopeptidase family protein [Sphingobacteriaceae bacterium]
NDAFGDYGATIILEHHYPFKFFTLFGHLSLNSIKDIFRGQPIKSGEAFAEFGNYTENGNWPPHLHFQLILDMEGYEGDYPGVCGISKQEMYLANSPDPKIILCHTFE